MSNRTGLIWAFFFKCQQCPNSKSKKENEKNGQNEERGKGERGRGKIETKGEIS